MSKEHVATYHVYRMPASTSKPESFFLVKKIGSKAEQSIWLGDEYREHRLVYLVPDDAEYLGCLTKALSDTTFRMTNEEGSWDMEASPENAWVFRGMLSGRMIVAMDSYSSYVRFALPVARDISKEREEAEWDAVLTMFPNAHKEPLSAVRTPSRRLGSSYSSDDKYYDPYLENSISKKSAGGSGKRR